MPDLKDLTGHKYGGLTVLRRAGKTKSGNATWLCRCEYCGGLDEVTSGDMRTGKARSCGCRKGRWKAHGEAAFNEWFAMRRYEALGRAHVWNLNKKDVWDLTQQLCHYCGTMPSQRFRTKADNGEFIYNGLDHVDNLRGYELGNVVPCCKVCNYAKSDRTVEDFYVWIERVYNLRTSWHG